MLLFLGVDRRELPVCSTDTKNTNSGGSGGSSILNLRTGRVQVPGNIVVHGVEVISRILIQIKILKEPLLVQKQTLHLQKALDLSYLQPEGQGCGIIMRVWQSHIRAKSQKSSTHL